MTDSPTSSQTQGTPVRHISAFVISLLLLLGATTAATAVEHADLGSIVSAQPAAQTPHVTSGGQVRAFTEVGGLIVVGGDFSQISKDGVDYPRQGLFAFDRVTGVPDPNFKPSVNGKVTEVFRVPGENAIVAVGFFTEVNGAEQRYVTKLNMQGQRDLAFTARTDRPVWGAAMAGSTIFLGGQFNGIGGLARERLGAIEASTGAVVADLGFDFADKRTTVETEGLLYVSALDVTADGSRVVAIGNFTKVDGFSRDQVVVFDTAVHPAKVAANWQTNAYVPACRVTRYADYLRDVDVSPDGNYFVIGTTGAYSSPPILCDTAARFELSATGNNIPPTWVSYTGGDTLTAVKASRDAVYLGGHQRWLNNPDAGDQKRAGAVDRYGIAAVDPINGIPLSWNPGRERGYGVGGFYVNDDGLYMGHDTFFVADEYHNKIALFPPGAGAAIVRPSPGSLPGTVQLPQSNGGLRLVDYNGTTTSNPVTTTADSRVPWNNVRALTRMGERLYTIQLETGSQGGLYRYDDGAPNGVEVDLNSLDVDIFRNGSKVYSRWRVDQITAMTFDPIRGRLYYTMSGQNNLYWRAFTAESDIVGSQAFSVTSSSQYGFSNVDGMFLAGESLYVTRSNGNLDRISFVNDTVVPGTTTTVSGTGIDGVNWSGVGASIATTAATLPGNLAPTAAFDVTCTGAASEVCTYDATRSSDRDGTVVGFEWFIDGVSVSTSRIHQQTYTTEATHTVRLVVTDDDGATDDETSTTTVLLPPTAVATVTCDGLQCAFDASGSSDGPDPVVSAAWDFGDATTGSGLTVVHDYIDEGAFEVTVTVTDNEGATATTTITATAIAPPGPVAFRGSDVANLYSSRPTVTIPANVLAGDTLLLFGSIAEVGLLSGTPTGGAWQLLGTRRSGDFESHVWWRVASATDAGTPVTMNLTSGRRVDLTIAAYEDANEAAPIAAWGGTAETVNRTDHTTPQVTTTADSMIVSYWANKSSDSTDWVPPVGETTRVETIGTTTRYVSTLLTDGGAVVAPGNHGLLTATTDTPMPKASMWTIALSKVDVSDQIGFVAAAPSRNTFTASPSVVVPSVTSVGDVLLLIATANRGGVLPAAPTGVTGWTLLDTVGTDAQTRVWWKAAVSGDASATVTVPLSQATKVGVHLVAYENVDVINPFVGHAGVPETVLQNAHTTPLLDIASQALVVSYWVDKSRDTTDWVAPTGESIRVESIEFGDGHIGSLITDGRVPTGPGSVGALTATANSPTSSGNMWTFALRPAN